VCVCRSGPTCLSGAGSLSLSPSLSLPLRGGRERERRERERAFETGGTFLGGVLFFLLTGNWASTARGSEEGGRGGRTALQPSPPPHLPLPDDNPSKGRTEFPAVARACVRARARLKTAASLGKQSSVAALRRVVFSRHTDARRRARGERVDPGGFIARPALSEGCHGAGHPEPPLAPGGGKKKRQECPASSPPPPWPNAAGDHCKCCCCTFLIDAQGGINANRTIILHSG
jgi:hypothetical protein